VRALIIETGRKLSPFGDPPDEALFAMGTVGGAVRASLERRGLRVERVRLEDPVPASDEPTLVLCDHTYLSDKCAGDFLADAFKQRGVVRLALCRTPASEYMRPVSSVVVEPLDPSGFGGRRRGAGKTDAKASERVCYDAFFAAAGKLPAADSCAALLDELREKSPRLVVGKREIVREVRMPIVGDAESTRMEFPITSTVAAHVEHWVHVLWLNQLAFGILWGETIRQHKLWALSRALLAFPWSMPRLFASLVRRGAGVRIHPTAHVEGSILGDGVVIGARASVRNSVLAPGTEVGDHATVITSVLGERSYVTPKTFFVWGAAYPDAVISNYKMQMSLVGRGASASTWAGLIDAKFTGAIEVLHDGERVSTERNFLGSCLGHDSHVGAKVLVLPGREVPNGAFITMRPDEIVREIPDSLEPGVPVVRDAGTLVPLDDVLARAKQARAAAVQSAPAKT
jgi:acetyltransferase-like isoleucine patch superfamily enzyme